MNQEGTKSCIKTNNPKPAKQARLHVAGLAEAGLVGPLNVAFLIHVVFIVSDVAEGLMSINTLKF